MTRQPSCSRTHEAVINAIEHADASELVQVKAARMNGLVTVDVQDSGRWKTEAPHAGRGIGLRLIEKLVHVLEIDKQPHGTSVRMLYRLNG